MATTNMAFDPLKYGATPVSQASTGFDPTKYGATPVQQHTSFLDELWGNLSGDFTKRTNAAANAQLSNQNPASKVLQTVGQGAGFVGDIGLDVAKAVTPKPIKQAVKSGIESVTATQPVQDVASKFDAWSKQHPEAAANLGAAVDIGSLIPGIGVGAKTAGVAEQGVKAGVGAAKEAATVAAEKGAEKAATKGLQYAVELGMPKVTSKEATAAIQGGRTTNPGLISKAKILPTPRDNMVGESIADVVSPKKNLVQNVDAIHQKLSQINNGVRNMIADNKVPFNSNQLRSRLNAAKEDNRLVFASDATAERTYNAVVDEFMRQVESGDTLGLFEARQHFDKIPAIKKLLDTEGLGENVRKQIVLDVRRAANEYVAEQLPANNPYRAALMKESHMLEALGNIAEKNAKTIGKNKLQILTEQYPILKWIAGTAVGAGGVGVGGALIGSTD